MPPPTIDEFITQWDEAAADVGGAVSVDSLTAASAASVAQAAAAWTDAGSLRELSFELSIAPGVGQEEVPAAVVTCSRGRPRVWQPDDAIKNAFRRVYDTLGDAGVEIVVCEEGGGIKGADDVFVLLVVPPQLGDAERNALWTRAVLATAAVSSGPPVRGVYEPDAALTLGTLAFARQDGTLLHCRAVFSLWLPPTRAAALAAMPGQDQVALCLTPGGDEVVATRLAALALQTGCVVLAPRDVFASSNQGSTFWAFVQMVFNVSMRGFTVVVPGVSCETVVAGDTAGERFSRLRELLCMRSYEVWAANPGDMPPPHPYARFSADGGALVFDPPPPFRGVTPAVSLFEARALLSRPQFLELAAALAAAPLTEWDAETPAEWSRLVRAAALEQERAVSARWAEDHARLVAAFRAAPTRRPLVLGGPEPPWVARLSAPHPLCSARNAALQAPDAEYEFTFAE